MTRRRGRSSRRGLEAEARQTLDNLATLVGLAGGSEANIVQLNMFGRDDSYKEAARRIFEERFPDPATRPVLHQLVNVVSSRMALAIEMMALLPENDGPSGEPFVELYSCEAGNAKPSGARIGDVVVSTIMAPVDQCSGKLAAADLDGQIEAVNGAIEGFLSANGLEFSDVARVTYFMPDLSERLKLNPPWVEWYPDPNDRPPHKYVPTPLPAGQLVAAQVIAMVGAGPRKCLEVPGVVHNDPMSMGALTGNLVTSSRVVTGSREGGLAEQTGDGLRQRGRHVPRRRRELRQRDAGHGVPSATRGFREDVERAMLALTPARAGPAGAPHTGDQPRGQRVSAVGSAGADVGGVPEGNCDHFGQMIPIEEGVLEAELVEAIQGVQTTFGKYLKVKEKILDLESALVSLSLEDTERLFMQLEDTGVDAYEEIRGLLQKAVDFWTEYLAAQRHLRSVVSKYQAG